MTSPLFPVTLTSKDTQRLSPYLTGWPRLAALLLKGVNVPDLQRLILLELEGAKRKPMLDRLMMRLLRLQRKALGTEVYRRAGR